MTASESSKERKTHKNMLEDQSKRADKPNNRIWRDKSKDIGERRVT